MTDAPHRTAACACGALRVETHGDPDAVVACNCLACQRRTGSVFGVGAYFRREQVGPVSGEYRTFSRAADSGRELSFHFCPTCGTTVFWDLQLRPGHYGIAVGAFADPNFPDPVRAVFTDAAHRWVAFPEDLPTYSQLAPLPPATTGND